MLDLLARKIQAARVELDATLSQIESLKTRLKTAKEGLEAWLVASGVLQDAARATQTLVHTQVADVVTRCLQTVYDDSLEFKIAFENKRGRTEARLYFTKGGNEVDPLEAGGLGWVEVASFALRMAVLKLHQPPVAPVLIADEPFKWVDKEAKPKMAELLVRLSEEMGVQFVLTTHDEEFMVGTVVRVK